MDKAFFTHLTGVWGRHKRLHVRNKMLVWAGSLVAVGAAIYLSRVLGSTLLLCVLSLVIFLRTLYLLGKGDWYDLASQIGLKCWKCGCVYNSDEVLADILQHNRCPRCNQPVYEMPVEDGGSGK